MHGPGDDVANMGQLELPPNAIGELSQPAAEQLRERLQMQSDRQQLQRVRNGRDVCWPDEHNPEPLVTVCIATGHNCDQLMDVSLPSALAQTYDNVEVLVIGDSADRTTTNTMRKIKNPRVRFIDAAVSSEAANSVPDSSAAQLMNNANDLARGAWLAPCGDSGQLTKDHIETLLRTALANRAELVYSKSLVETRAGWQVVGAKTPLDNGFLTGSAFWSSALRFMKMSTTCHILGESQDKNLMRCMNEIGVRTSFCDQVTYKMFDNDVVLTDGELVGSQG